MNQRVLLASACAAVIYKLHSLMLLKQTDTFRRWELGLRDQKARAIIAARLLRLASGLPGDVAAVGEGISELRIHYGPGFRVYFQQRGEEIVVLLCGGDKSSQARDIALAKKLAAEWENQNGGKAL